MQKKAKLSESLRKISKDLKSFGAKDKEKVFTGIEDLGFGEATYKDPSWEEEAFTPGESFTAEVEEEEGGERIKSEEEIEKEINQALDHASKEIRTAIGQYMPPTFFYEEYLDVGAPKRDALLENLYKMMIPILRKKENRIEYSKGQFLDPEEVFSLVIQGIYEESDYARDPVFPPKKSGPSSAAEKYKSYVLDQQRSPLLLNIHNPAVKQWEEKEYKFGMTMVGQHPTLACPRCNTSIWAKSAGAPGSIAEHPEHYKIVRHPEFNNRSVQHACGSKLKEVTDQIESLLAHPDHAWIDPRSNIRPVIDGKFNEKHPFIKAFREGGKIRYHELCGTPINISGPVRTITGDHKVGLIYETKNKQRDIFRGGRTSGKTVKNYTIHCYKCGTDSNHDGEMIDNLRKTPGTIVECPTCSNSLPTITGYYADLDLENGKKYTYYPKVLLENGKYVRDNDAKSTTGEPKITPKGKEFSVVGEKGKTRILIQLFVPDIKAVSAILTASDGEETEIPLIRSNIKEKHLPVREFMRSLEAPLHRSEEGQEQTLMDTVADVQEELRGYRREEEESKSKILEYIQELGGTKDVPPEVIKQIFEQVYFGREFSEEEKARSQIDLLEEQELASEKDIESGKFKDDTKSSYREASEEHLGKIQHYSICYDCYDHHVSQGGPEYTVYNEEPERSNFQKKGPTEKCSNVEFTGYQSRKRNPAHDIDDEQLRQFGYKTIDEKKEEALENFIYDRVAQIQTYEEMGEEGGLLPGESTAPSTRMKDGKQVPSYEPSQNLYLRLKQEFEQEWPIIQRQKGKQGKEEFIKANWERLPQELKDKWNGERMIYRSPSAGMTFKGFPSDHLPGGIWWTKPFKKFQLVSAESVYKPKNLGKATITIDMSQPAHAIARRTLDKIFSKEYMCPKGHKFKVSKSSTICPICDQNAKDLRAGKKLPASEKGNIDYYTSGQYRLKVLKEDSAEDTRPVPNVSLTGYEDEIAEDARKEFENWREIHNKVIELEDKIR